MNTLRRMHSWTAGIVIALVLAHSSLAQDATKPEPPAADSAPAADSPNAVAESSTSNPTQAGLAELLLGSLSPEHMKAFAEMLEQDWKNRPEWGDMTLAILKGERMRPGMGWWRPTAKRYDWQWLSQELDGDKDGAVAKEELPSEFSKRDLAFTRLDRDLDGKLTAADFDHSDPPGMSIAGMQNMMVQYLFARLDADSNGRVTLEELAAFFARADAEEFGYLTAEDLRAALDDGSRRNAPNRSGGEPAQSEMIRMLFSGQLGNFESGPELGQPAPDFELVSHDGQRTIKLSDSFHKKPVVLIFGSFT